MKRGFYRRMAWMGITKNAGIYLPYMFTCIGSVMLYYIVAALREAPSIRGHASLCMMLSFGTGVIAVFSAIFLFYSHSFLIRRRNREFGLYNILGMNKSNIGRILLWETVITAGISLTAGLALGILLSKLAELLLLNIVRMEVTYGLFIGTGAILTAVIVFTGIFGLLLLISLARVRLTDPLALMKSDHVGEKPPRANFVLALAGILILGAAYWIAVTIEAPMKALMWFFIAVLMVIVSTYLLFTAGSVSLCRLLQRKKSYYYKASHFVSVSSMAYRMKRNGLGLASICILSTMVLVTMSSTSCLFIGSDASLKSMYPNDLSLTFWYTDPEQRSGDAAAAIREAVSVIAEKFNGVFTEYSVAEIHGLIQPDGTLAADPDGKTNYDESLIRTVCAIPLEDYCRMTGQSVSIGQGEALIDAEEGPVSYSTFSIDGKHPLSVRQAPASVHDAIGDRAAGNPRIIVIVPDFNGYVDDLLGDTLSGGSRVISLRSVFTADADVGTESWDEAQEEIFRELDGVDADILVTNRAAMREDFLGVYGSLFFVGILLSAAFLAAAMLIIYYKQTSEGYEDRERFSIMRKIGMTAAEIRGSVNSQVLMVFMPPLILAGIHTAFAFPLVYRILMIFSVYDLPLMLIVTAVTYLAFCVLYASVYFITSRACISIVGGKE